MLSKVARAIPELDSSKALSGNTGPAFRWDILQYGRLLNNVRLQDARFLELVTAYKQSVLTANQEAENGLVTFLKAQERYQWQKKSADAGRAALDTVREQWKAGVVDFTRVALDYSRTRCRLTDYAGRRCRAKFPARA
jgi:outer membrane protein TolC